MNRMPDSFGIAIIGGGAGGVLAAMHILQQASHAIDVALIEPVEKLAEGVAYATPSPDYLLNVPVAKMSAFERSPKDFLDYQQARHMSEFVAERWAGRFAPRCEYADYLRLRLRQAQESSVARLHVLRDRVVSLEDAGEDRALLSLQSGKILSATSLLLCIGNTCKTWPVESPQAIAGRCIDAWDYAAIASIPPGARVVVVGTGLSMADTLAALHGQGHQASIDVLSRHALLPLAHASDSTLADFDTEALLRLDLRGRVRRLRELAHVARTQGRPWQSVMERIRPLGQGLWQSMSAQDQKRFLRHVRRYWDVHRHRIDPALHMTIAELLDDGRVCLHRAGLRALTSEATHVRVDMAGCDGVLRSLAADVVVNATGIESRLREMPHPLLRQCLEDGHIQPGPHGLGVHATEDGSLIGRDGQVRMHWRVLGSLRIGELWESLAIPELRVQAERIARDLVARTR